MKVKLTEFIEVNVEFPMYLKYGMEIYAKLVNEKDVVSLSYNSISFTNIAEHYLTDDDYQKCTAKEFETAYTNVLERIEQIKNKL